MSALHNSPLRRSAPGTAPECVVVGVSGGVDSAVSLLLLREQGHELRAVFMKNWEEDDEPGHCAAAEDLAEAEAVCDALGVPLRTVNLAAEYWDRVFARFLAEHAAGRTPNPDVLCNAEIKFQAFLEFAATLGGTRVATGHYARVRRERGRYVLLRGVDADKDQSYFLHALNQSQLAGVSMPLGELRKSEVRALARRAGLRNHDRRDSTGICFIGERPFRSFLSRYLSTNPGDIVSLDGDLLGRHEGLAFYTIGQRQGLRLGGRASGSGEPWYVAAKRPADNTLVVVQGRAHGALYARTLRTGTPSWIADGPPCMPLRCTAKTRYRQADQACVVDASENGGCRVRFEHPQWAPTPGQYVVFYRGEECLGGAVIEATEDAPAALDQA